MAASLVARDLAHRYGPRRGLEPVSFALETPGVVAVTGVNGSGKSTLLRIMAGLLRPSRGECRLAVGGREVRMRALHVGFASPDLSFYEEFSAAENLSFAAEARGLAAPREVAIAALARVGLAARAAGRVAALSSGMRQRMRLAFALLGAPAVVVLDEPGSHLDDEGRALLQRLIVEARGRALTVIATNDEREWRLADQRIELAVRGLGDPA
jgi:heme exporter protein A